MRKYYKKKGIEYRTINHPRLFKNQDKKYKTDHIDGGAKYDEFTGKKVYTLSGKYTGCLYYTLSDRNKQDILRLRHGDPPNFTAAPRMSFIHLSKMLKLDPNYIGRFCREYYNTYGYPYIKKLSKWSNIKK